MREEQVTLRASLEKRCVFKYSIGNLSSLALLPKDNYLRTWHFQGPTVNEERMK